MGLKDLKIKNSYSSDDDDVLKDFYVPVLSEAIEYNRLTGFFFSSSLAVAAKGIVNLIENDGKMKIVSSAFLSKRDVESIKEGIVDPENLIEKNMLKSFEEMENEFVENHIKALGWMVAKNKLEIKVAILKDNEGFPLSSEKVSNTGIFHEKVGIFKDEKGDRLSFSGSINETGAAWKNNIEEFKIFREWKRSEREYFNFDLKKFNKFWNNEGNRIDVIDIPEAIEKKLVSIKHPNFDNLKAKLTKTEESGIELFDHQKSAVKNWFENNQRGLFQMATGTGKTIAALGLLREVQKQENELITIISCPYNHLITQWEDEMEEFGINRISKVIADSTNNNWRNDVVESIIDIQLGHEKNLVIFTTHRTLSSDDFRKIIKNNIDDLPVLLIADEVHAVGAEVSQKGLLNKYDYRLGLSATPKRWFDIEGTEKLYEYFNGVVFKFGLKKAINEINPMTGKSYLTPYRYIPNFITLDNEEIEEYQSKTKAIVMRYHNANNKEEEDEVLENLLYKRADIVKNAEKKYEALEQILDEIYNEIEGTIIYCSPQQIDRIMDILNERNLVCHRFTMDEGTTPDAEFNGKSERDYLLDLFEKGEYQVLVAMKCLDEGIDVPPAKNAILMASSGNPREYIQRIGRVIRRHPSKREAKIFDIIVEPSKKNLPPDLKDVEEKIFQKEVNRYKEIAEVAKNNTEAFQILNKTEV